MTISDVHTHHCCKVCGCKYGNDDCTVTNNIAPAEYGCEYCNDIMGTEFVKVDKYVSEIELHRLLGRAEALIGLMRDRLHSDESSHSIRLIDGAEQWIDDLNEMTKDRQ